MEAHYVIDFLIFPLPLCHDRRIFVIRNHGDLAGTNSRESTIMDEGVSAPRAQVRIGGREVDVHTGRREAERLSVLKIRAIIKAGQAGRWRDGKCLSLVSKTGFHFYWEHDPIRNGVHYYFSYGNYPEVSLAEAREAAAQDRGALRRGEDPRVAKKAMQSALAHPQMTFRDAYEAWFLWKLPTWRPDSIMAAKNPFDKILIRDLDKIKSIAAKPVNAITSDDAYEILISWGTSQQMHQIRGRLAKAIDYAIARGWRERGLVNPFSWAANLDVRFDQTKPVSVPRPGMGYALMPAFMAGLRAEPTIATMALEILVLSSSRIRTVQLATWAEVDLENLVWIRPAANMKSKNEHVVPITPRMAEIFRYLHSIRVNQFVFPSLRAWRHTPISRPTIRHLMPKPCEIHGLRSDFAMWRQEMTEFDSQAAEVQLDHVIRSAINELIPANKTERVYARSPLLEKRRIMMTAWDAFLTSTV